MSAQPVLALQERPCDDPELDPWVAALHERVVRFNGLAEFAIGTWGELTACSGEVTTEFDGVRYGRLRLTFEGGATLEVETQPIETSIVALRSPAGFPDPIAAESALRAYAAGVGVSIDWGRPERLEEGALRSATYRDPEPGLNASAVLVTTEDRLVEVRFSLAL